MALEDDIKTIHEEFPWASGETMTTLAKYSESNSDVLKKTLANLMGDDFDPDVISKVLDDSHSKMTKYNAALQKSSKEVTNIFRVVSRDVSPLEATAELMSIGAQGLNEVVGDITKFTGKIPGFGWAASMTAKAATGALVAATGVAAIYAKLVTEQEKTVRMMIDHGAIVDNLKDYSDMRRSLADLGMSMQEMSLMFNENKIMLSNLPGDLMSSAKNMTDFIVDVETEASKSMGDFGYNTEQLTSRMLEEASLLYTVGELETLNQQGKDKIRRNFENSTAMTTFLAEKFGDQRSVLLAQRQEAMSNIDFMAAMHKNGEYLAEKYGENAKENVKNTGANLKMLLSTVLGPEFGDQAQQVFNNVLRDIDIDESAMNNIPGDMINVLNALGPDVLNSFSSILEEGATGQLNEEQLVMRVQELTRTISKSKPKVGDNPIIQQHNMLLAHATNAPEAFMKMTDTQMSNGIALVKKMSESADKSIDAVDETRKAFRKIVDMMSPGFETSNVALQWFTSALEFVYDAFVFVGLIDTPKIIPDELVAKRDMQAKIAAAEKAQRELAAQQASGGRTQTTGVEHAIGMAAQNEILQLRNEQWNEERDRLEADLQADLEKEYAFMSASKREGTLAKKMSEHGKLQVASGNASMDEYIQYLQHSFMMNIKELNDTATISQRDKQRIAIELIDHYEKKRQEVTRNPELLKKMLQKDKAFLAEIQKVVTHASKLNLTETVNE